MNEHACVNSPPAATSRRTKTCMRQQLPRCNIPNNKNRYTCHPSKSTSTVCAASRTMQLPPPPMMLGAVQTGQTRQENWQKTFGKTDNAPKHIHATQSKQIHSPKNQEEKHVADIGYTQVDQFSPAAKEKQNQNPETKKVASFIAHR